MNHGARKAYSYLRFSTPEQSKGDSLRRQTALAEAYAKTHGLALDAELNLKDLGVSAYRGANAAVGALGAFLQAVRDRLVPKGSLLLIESLDRVSRQTARKAVRTLEDIVEAGVVVVTLTDGKQWTAESLDGADFLFAVLLFMRGNEESLMKSKRVKATWVAKRERAAHGEIQTIRAPLWLKAEGSGAKESRNAKFAVIPDRAKLIQRMFDMFLGGQGKKGIAQTFNHERIRPWGAAKHWYSNYIFRCLTNPAVTGVYTPHLNEHRDGRLVLEPQKPVADYYPRVVDDTTFERAQTLINGRTNPVRNGRVASLVAGLARCPQCGGTMTRVARGRRRGAPVLVCVKAKAGAGCKFHSVRLPDVEQALIENAAALRKPPIAEGTLADEIDAADEELYHTGKQIEELVTSIEHKASPALSNRLAEREAYAARVSAELERLRARAAETESRVVKLRASRLADALANLKPETLAVANAALRECLVSVTVDYVEGVLKLQWRHGPVTELQYTPGTQWKNLAPARAAAR